MPLPRDGLWQHPDFLRLWAAQAVSALGSRVSRTALPIIAIVSLGADAAGVALLAALSTAPGLVVGLFAGGLVDRSRKRPLLIGADLARAALILSVPVAAWAGGLSLVQLYVVSALVGMATSLFQIADNAYLPSLVGQDHLVEANAKLEATEAAAEIAGPGAAGILIQLLTAPVTMVADALSYLGSAALLGRIRAAEAPALPEGDAAAGGASLLEDLRVGLRHGFGHPVVGPTFMALGAQALSGGFFFALYMLYLLEHLRLDAAATGLIISVGGIGALGGSVVAGWLGRRLGAGPAMILSLAVGQAGSLLIPLAARLGPLTVPALVLHQLLGDGLMVAFMIHAVSARQAMLPLHVLGRVNATLHVLTGALLLLGTLTAGWLAGQLGLETTVWLGVLGGLAAPLLLLRPAIWRLKAV
ncbi:MFS transporter [Sorangium cellulosum]|uniref:MFS transporter n=1 Tax=Sorangium cellulosum TaxID=56 RepID=A0A2L0EY03_SORCE|nr:MFS transporter [Sorangium cellulosum]AUX44166.1 MFS transporter [Sorangium cellulosum]